MTNSRDSRTALLLVAIAINAVEFFLPRIPFFPWLKPGLANIVTIVWIVRYGTRDALLFAILRTWVVAFYFGFSLVTVALSLSGGLASCVVMAALWHVWGGRGTFGAVGIAVAGALLHNATQLGVVYLMLARNLYLLYQVPVMLVASVLFGAIVGVLAPSFYRAVDRHFAERMDDAGQSRSGTPPAPEPVVAWSGALLLTFCMLLVAVVNTIVLVSSALTATIAAIVVRKRFWHTLTYPFARFWILFLFVAVLHAFFTMGRSVPGIPLVTLEGAQKTLLQWLRLWTWLEISLLLTAMGFHTVAHGALRRVFPAQQDTLYAGLRAVELFPATMDLVRANGPRLARLLIRRPSVLLEELLREVWDLVAPRPDRQEREDHP